MMYAVICDIGDRPALWATDRMRARLGDVRVIPLDLLALTPDFRLALGTETDAASIRLPDGTEFGPACCAGLLNRVTRPPRAGLGQADAAYAAEEMTAVTLAFLAAFGARAINQPDPAALSGRDFGPQGWLHMAALAGLPAVPFAIGDGPVPSSLLVASHMLVIGERVLGGPASHRARAVDLAQIAGLQVMSLQLAADGTVLGGSALPDLSLAKEAGADALAALLWSLA